MAEYNKLLIPESIDLEALIENGGFREIPNFHPDKLAYILFLVDYVASLSPTNIMEGGYTSLNAERLQDVLGRQYHQYLDRLQLAGVIDIDKHFIVGEKNRGYRYTEPYKKDFARVFETSSLFSKHIRAMFSTQKRELDGYEHLTKWFNPKLQVNNPELVMEFCKLRYSYVTSIRASENYNRWLSLFDGGETSYFEFKKFAEASWVYDRKLQFSTHQLQMGWYPLSVDDTSFRFHSNLTRLKSELRNALTYDGKQLVSLDIKNSQPYFSLVLLQDHFWYGDPTYMDPNFFKKLRTGEPILTTPPPNTREIPFNIARFSKIHSLLTTNKSSTPDTDTCTALITLQKSSQFIDSQDIKLYNELVSSGKLYEYIAKYWQENGMEVPEDRQALKAGVFQTMFTDNRFSGQEEAKPKRLFKAMFPMVVTLFETLKRQDSTILPILLQTIESHLILKVITKRISKEHPRLPIFTIHDSIITTVGSEDYVLSVMEEELEKAVGVKPSIKKEYYSIDVLEREVEKLRQEVG